MLMRPPLARDRRQPPGFSLSSLRNRLGLERLFLCKEGGAKLIGGHRMLARTAFALTCVLPLLIASAQSQPSDRDAPMTGSGLEEREERNSPAPLASSHGPLWTRRDSLPAT